MGATLHRDARASHYRGLSCCGAQAPDAHSLEVYFEDCKAVKCVCVFGKGLVVGGSTLDKRNSLCKSDGGVKTWHIHGSFDSWMWFGLWEEVRPEDVTQHLLFN